MVVVLDQQSHLFPRNLFQLGNMLCNLEIHRDFMVVDDNALIRLVFHADPGVSLDSLQVDSQLRIRVDQSFQQVLDFVGKKLREQETSPEDLLEEKVGVWVFEGKKPANHGVENDSGRPDINHLARVVLSGNHFWSGVAGGAAGSFQQLAFSVDIRETKIDEFDVVFGVEEKVFGLQVPVTNLETVQILQAIHELTEHFFGFFFEEEFLLDDVLVELPVFAVLEIEVGFALGFLDVVELDDVWVSNHLQNLNFSSNSLLFLRGLDLGLIDDFHGELLPGLEVLREIDFTEASFSEFLHDGVVFGDFGVVEGVVHVHLTHLLNLTHYITPSIIRLRPHPG